MSTIVIRSMMKAALRDKISLFYAAIFPAILMVGLGLYIKGTAYHETLFVGSLALGTVFWSVQGVAFQVLQHRNRGVYKLLRTTPLKVSMFIVGMTIARAILGLAVNVFVLVVGLVFFRMALPIPTILSILFILTIASLAFSVLGFLVVNLARNEGQINMIANLIYLPMVFGSQAFYSLNHAPRFLVILGKCFPFEYFVESMNHVVRGTYQGVATDVIVVTGFAVVFLVLSAITFQFDNDGFRFDRKFTPQAR